MNSVLLQTRDLEIGYKIRRPASAAATHGHRYMARVVAGHLSLSLRQGELVCLLGPNGSGKSTLMRTLAGVQKALGGQVRLEGREISRMSPREVARKLSLVLTDRVATGNLNVYALVALGRYPYTGWMGRLSEKDEAVVRHAIESTGIRRFALRHISDLSDGERQKVMIARALAQDTPVIMLDEPTAHLDLPNRIEVMSLLKELARKQGKAVVMSTHELDLALQAADRIWLMGSPGSDGTPAEMVSGMPEELVLDGRLEGAFKRNGFEFDRHSGSFRIHHEPEETIGLVGDGAEAYWTRRALERKGFRVVSGPDMPFRVEIRGREDERAWTYVDGKGGVQDCCDICSLIDALEQRRGA